MTKASKRFTWAKPIVKPRDAEPGQVERRLRSQQAVKPAKTQIQAEYDSLKQKRRGQDES
jgi:hypothetical protein